MATDNSLTLSADEVHDLKNQLGIVLGFIELMIEDTPESDPRHGDLTEIRKAAKACLALITASSGDTRR